MIPDRRHAGRGASPAGRGGRGRRARAARRRRRGPASRSGRSPPRSASRASPTGGCGIWPRRTKENWLRLADDAADGRGEAARLGAVDDHFGDGELAGERLALRFPIDGAGEALGLGVGGLAAGIIGDQIGEAAIVARRARRSRRPRGVVATAWVRPASGAVGRGGILEVVEAERFGGQGTLAGMVGIGDGRGRPRSARRSSGLGKAAGRAKSRWQPRSGPRRGRCVALKLKSVRSAGRKRDGNRSPDCLPSRVAAWPDLAGRAAPAPALEVLARAWAGGAKGVNLRRSFQRRTVRRTGYPVPKSRGRGSNCAAPLEERLKFLFVFNRLAATLCQA